MNLKLNTKYRIRLRPTLSLMYSVQIIYTCYQILNQLIIFIFLSFATLLNYNYWIFLVLVETEKEAFYSLYSLC